MGGEIYPPLQDEIFNNSYPAGTPFHQDFVSCVNVTHATYMLNNYAFTGYSTTEELNRAISASNGMGYSFFVSQVEVASSSNDDDNNNDDVSITVEVMQKGVSPF